MMAKRKRPRLVRPSSATVVGGVLQGAIESHQAGKFAQAEQAYKRILVRDPKHASAHHLLGRLYWQTERRELGVESLQRALAIESDSPRILLDLANMLSGQGELEPAEQCLLEAVRLSPHDAIPLNNLGVVLKDQQRYPEAIDSYRRALAIEPRNIGTLMNLAHSLSLSGDLGEAVQVYRQVVSLDTTNINALSSLASLLRRMGRHQDARDVFNAWLTLEPRNPVPRHLLSAYDDSGFPDRASDEYVRHVFDQFAETFEENLGRLDYRGPQLIEQGLRRAFATSRKLDFVLDAGCGTGLCGPALRPFARELIGVDLSSKMLAVAAERKLYDSLFEAELCEYLANHVGKFDLIACADTFGYFGNLANPFAAARVALRKGGTFLLTVELGGDGIPADYVLRTSGRYAHRHDYVLGSCVDVGFTISHQTEAVLRMEANCEVRCLVLIAIAS